MAIDAATLVGGALGGAVVQSVLGPLVGQRHERRNLRAKVLERLAAVEDSRWAPAKRADFLRSIVELRSTALVAGLNRGPIELYVMVAAAGRTKSEEDWELSPDYDAGSSIPADLGDLVREAAKALANYAWHPYWRRLTLSYDRRRLNRLKDEVTRRSEADAVTPIDWERGLMRVVKTG